MQDKIGAVLVVGAGISGIQSALDLADSGYKVYLLDKKPSIGGTMAQLDKTFPTNDCSMCILAPKLVGAGRHHNIELITNADVESIEGEVGNFKVTINKRARHIIEDKCTGCAECVDVCPVSVPDEYNEVLNDRKAIYLSFPQAVPRKVSISKRGIPPCRATCPAGINGQGYVALTAAGKFKEALEIVKEKAPFPAVLGRICHHPCETECNRRDLDEAVAICELKRFLADHAYEHGTEESPVIEEKKEEKIAIIGSGPAGLTAANNLARKGYQVTVFEALSIPGGMLAVGIPDYRLPRDVLNREIDAIKNLGVEIKLNSPIGNDLTIQNLFDQGYKTVFVATGAHNSMKLGVEGEDLEGVYHGVNFLRDVALGKNPNIGKKVAVIGGGNVAIDSVRTAARMGAEAMIVYRRGKEEMPAYQWEIEETEEEGIKLHFLAAPNKIIGESGKVTGIECIKMQLGEPDESGRRRPEPLPGSEFTIEVDTVIPAIGQMPDVSFMTDDATFNMTKWNTFIVNPNSLMTSIEGVFAGGDNVLGPASAVEAIAHGNKVAEAIDQYIRDESPAVESQPIDEIVTYDDLDLKFPEELKKPREKPTFLPATERVTNFNEVITKTFTEEQAKAEAERCLNCGLCSECLECVKVCLAEALDHDQTDEAITIDVGSVILSPGFDEFDPRIKKEYGYGKIKNVISSIEFERILSATGPFEGHIKRTSDHKQPETVAFIQCVGSRDTTCGNEYCSSVCCMYSIKEAIIAQEHTPGLKTEIFFMDMRAFGKEFDDYYQRAQKEYGIKFTRCRVANLDKAENDNVTVNYVEDGEIKSKEFDLAVLAVGFESTKTGQKLAEQFGIDLNKYNFAQTELFSPLESTKPGIFISGAFNGPKDIPDTVAQASGAAAKASSVISEARGTLVTEKEYPQEKDISGEEPRIGVFVCHCGINIGGTVDVPSVVEYAETLPNVTYAEHNLFTCSQDTQEKIKEMIVEHDLNRVIVASCTPRTHEPLFRSTTKEAGINPYLFEMANIRDQCSWVHMHEKEDATEKAKVLVNMAVAKSRLLEPLYSLPVDVTQEALVIGGGLSGMTTALEIANNGFSVHLVEKEPELGGNLKDLYFELGSDRSPQELLKDLKSKLSNNPLIKVYTDTAVNSIDGFIGNFTTTLSDDTEIKHGIIIVATGAKEYMPSEYLYGQNEKVMTQKELEKKLANGKVPKGSVVMIQCVGSRTEERPNCSRICCTNAIKNALKIKELSPETEIYVLYKDIRTYGYREEYYRKAGEAGVRFIRYDDENKPMVTEDEKDNIEVRIKDPVSNDIIILNPDTMALSAATVPWEGNEELAKMLKVPLSKDKFFLEAHMKLRPVDFATEGIFLCGLAHWPKFIDECISQANAAVSRAMTIISKDKLEGEAVIANVDEEKCCGCKTCEVVCSFNALQVQKNEIGWKAEVIVAACKGCGSCATACPEGAITMRNFTNEQLISAGIAAVREPEGIVSNNGTISQEVNQ